MKNIHVLPTEKPSQIYKEDDGSFQKDFVLETYCGVDHYHIYITSDEEIKEGDWFITTDTNLIHKSDWVKFHFDNGKKIILTTDPDLIKDGVQAIEDEFLDWFIKNPSFEYIHLGYKPSIKKWYPIIPQQETTGKVFYESADKIIMVKRQETLEEAAERLFPVSPQKRKLWIEGAKWQAKRTYTEQEVEDILINALHSVELKHNRNYTKIYEEMKVWFQNNKKK